MVYSTNSSEPSRLEQDALRRQARNARFVAQPPATPKRRMPKVTRLQTRRQRIAESQTLYFGKAIFGGESKWNATPLAVEGFEGTREVGPHDQTTVADYSAAKATHSTGTGRNFTRAKAKRPKSKTLDALLKEYGI